MGHFWDNDGTILGQFGTLRVISRDRGGLPMAYRWLTNGLPTAYRWLTHGLPMAYPLLGRTVGRSVGFVSLVGGQEDVSTNSQY